MKTYISQEEIYIHYDDRSISKYHPQLSAHVQSIFAAGTYTDETSVKKIIETYYTWSAGEILKLIGQNNDMLFVNYLFAYHESSVLLWMRQRQGENLFENYGISEDDLSLNRRILKLALEQTCDINYQQLSNATPQLLQRYDEAIEDLLYLGSELYNAAQFLAELRMIPNSLQATFQSNGLLHIVRKGPVEPVFQKLFLRMHEDFQKGIMDIEGVKQLKDEIQNCFGINYDFAAQQIIHIKKHHNPDNWEFQTIEPGILAQNLIHNGATQENAQNFYAGLILNSENKLSIEDAVYRVNSMERYFFRPILEMRHNGNPRQLIGIEKWAESITVLATNNFQWNKAPAEWKRNACFQAYLERKSNEHDALLEDEVDKILTENKIPFFRNITSFNDGKNAKTLNVAGAGEIDFIWFDATRRRLIVADCKYNRPRYDMIAFSADFTNFKDIYEKKIEGKMKWINENRELVLAHFRRQFPHMDMKLKDIRIGGLFIINTPTLYMYLGRVDTVCFFGLNAFMKNGYKHPDLAIQIKDGHKTTIKIKPYPYFLPKKIHP